MLAVFRMEPAPYSQKDPSGVEHVLWTTVGMPMMAPANTILLCKYNAIRSILASAGTDDRDPLP